MPWTTPTTFTTGNPLTLAQANAISDNLRMGGPVFTTEAARDAAITAPEAGMTAYLTAPTSAICTATGATTAIPAGIQTIYNGSVWVCVTPVGARTDASGTVTNAGYTATLGGSPGTNPSVTLVTGTTALVSIANISQTSSGTNGVLMSVAVSGAGTVAASDSWATYCEVTSISGGASVAVITGLTAGTNTFTLQYKAAASTGTFQRRRITVQGIA